MPGICTASVSPNNCGHRTLTVNLDGTIVVLELHENAEPLSEEEKQQFVVLAARHLRNKGVTLATFLNRCVIGEEASNVKIYTFFGPGAAITKTNIGAAYVNICPGLNGERVAVDFSGCTQYRLMLSANLVGTGQFSARIVRDSDVNDVLHDAPNLGAAGEREADTDWQNLPAWALGQGITYLRAQAKSQTAADDPVFRRLQLGLR